MSSNNITSYVHKGKKIAIKEIENQIYDKPNYEYSYTKFIHLLQLKKTTDK